MTLAMPAGAAVIRGVAADTGFNEITDAFVDITSDPDLDFFETQLGSLGLDGDNPNFATEAIEYFIPLGNSLGFFGGGPDGDYGRVSDSGFGQSDATLAMNILFRDIQPNTEYTLEIYFEDLDLTDTDDGPGFNESFNIYTSRNPRLQILPGTAPSAPGEVPLFTAASQSPSLSGTSDIQSAILNLGVINTGTTPVEGRITLAFSARSDTDATNSSEFLAPFLRPTQTTPVPLPAAGWMLIAGIGALGWMARRKGAA
ncbi:MAG: VPLPA-CTERM sorting domain-containing protein [Pseudomonadota bacterium]